MNKKESDHQYYLRNHEKIKERVKRYAEEHKDEIKIKQKKAYQKRKEKLKAECKFTVYLRTNLVNGMRYVGQTEDFKRRENDWNCLKTIYANNLITEDREKYGIDNWTVEILAVVESREEAWELEEKYIKEFNTRFPNGYNLAKGGGGCKGIIAWNKGVKMPDEAIQKMRVAKIGKEPWNKGLKDCYSEETLKKMSDKRKNISDETRRKMSESRKGKPAWNKGLKGTHFSIETEFKGLECVQLKDGKFVKLWPTLKEAAESLPKCYVSSISRCCKGITKTAGGFEWMYKSDYEKMINEKNIIVSDMVNI